MSRWIALLHLAQLFSNDTGGGGCPQYSCFTGYLFVLELAGQIKRKPSACRKAIWRPV